MGSFRSLEDTATYGPAMEVNLTTVVHTEAGGEQAGDQGAEDEGSQGTTGQNRARMEPRRDSRPEALKPSPRHRRRRRQASSPQAPWWHSRGHNQQRRHHQPRGRRAEYMAPTEPRSLTKVTPGTAWPRGSSTSCTGFWAYLTEPG